VWANDNDPDAAETYRANIGSHIVLGDIATISSEEIPPHDVLIGGFPCQGFSAANVKRRQEDRRNSLYLELLRVVRDKQPKFFVAENVKGILTLAKGRVFKMILGDFSAENYSVTHWLLNAADYGVPQRRERVFIVGVREDVRLEIKPPQKSHTEQPDLFGNLKKWVSIGEALKDLPDPAMPHDLPNHTYSKFKLKFNGYLGNRAIDPSRPAPTVTARGDGRGGVVVLHHPLNHRRMSARELASTQSFPPTFAFYGTRSSAYRQIGNAVPPLLAYAVAMAFPRGEHAD
jgi:DNA (cytosine-5)-methyltransferase 1